MITVKNNRPIRVGVLGVGRGKSFTGNAAKAAGFELVAVCDTWEERLKKFGEERKVAIYTEYAKFLEHDMDAVVLANYFHQHAPFAIKALKAGMHVMSETAACHTLGEGVELIRAVEKAGKTYMFAENYPYMRHNQEMRRLFKAGEFGTFMYGECEYVHPMDADSANSISPGLNHWRNWIPATYYCTHGMAPVMFITDTWPVKVNGFVVHTAPDNPEGQRRPSLHDGGAMMAVRMDNDAVVKLLQGGLRGHDICTRIHAAKGYMEGRNGQVTLIRQQWHEKRKHPERMTYTPDFPVMNELAMKTGHGGGDFYTMYYFADAIRKKEQPYLDVYRGVAMSIVGIQAYRSALADGETVVVPDLRKESARKYHAKDDWSPDPARRRTGQPWSSVEGNKKPSAFALNYARKIWKKTGYTGK
ncbi:MAG: Gfo/Idh/MocA family oxidoreductase [Kiritimatiellae bacterium]|nr:Gfo/Idh/MocA family oxidoreductase [Kiritimatiellia bacterium]